MARITAEVRATRHAYKHHHEVEITASNLHTLTNEIHEVISPRKQAQLTDEAPPF
jgi:hypothetical protein